MLSCKEITLSFHRVSGNVTVKGTCFQQHLRSSVVRTETVVNTLVLTVLVPLTNEIRFRLMGSRINIQLKFKHSADALAQASVDLQMEQRQNQDAQ